MKNKDEKMIRLQMQVKELKAWKANTEKETEKDHLLIKQITEENILLKKDLKEFIRINNDLQGKLNIQLKSTFGRNTEKYKDVMNKEESHNEDNKPENEPNSESKGDSASQSDSEGDSEIDKLRRKGKSTGKRNKHPKKGKSKKGNHTGKQKFDPTKPREIIEITMGDSKCPYCHGELKEIFSNQDTEFIEIIEKNLKIIKEIHHKYICTSCKRIFTAKTRDTRYNKGGLVGNDLLAYCLVNKYVRGLSCGNLSDLFLNSGYLIAAKNISNWCVTLGNDLIPLADAIRQSLLSGPAIGSDESNIKVMEEEFREDRKKSWLWVIRGMDPQKPGVYYRYDASRSGEVFQDIIGSYSGYIMSDAMGVYTTQKVLKYEFISCLCLCHSRRRFTDVMTADSYKKGSESYTTIDTILKLFGNIFHIDKTLCQKFKDGLPEKDFLMERKTKILAELSQLADYITERALIHKFDERLLSALNYFTNNKESFKTFLDCPYLTCSNNLTEQSVKSGLFKFRHNSQFAGSPNGAIAMAAIETVLQTAIMNGLNVDKYARYLVEQLAIIKSDKKRRKRKKLPEITYDYTQFIPFNLSKEVLEEIKTKMVSMQNKKLAPKQVSSHRTYHYQKNYAYL